jgi:glucose-fructose oxidoreductase
MGVYCINAARYLFRAEPLEVCALAERGNDERFRRVEEMVSAVLRFPGERLATFTCSFGAADVSRFTLVGSEGILRADPAYEYAEGIRWEATIADKKRTRSFPKRDQFAAELMYFSNCILHDKQPEPSGLEGLADVRIIEEIYHSIRTRRTVAITQPTGEKKRPSETQEIHRPAHGKPEVFHAHSASREAA